MAPLSEKNARLIGKLSRQVVAGIQFHSEKKL